MQWRRPAFARPMGEVRGLFAPETSSRPGNVSGERSGWRPGRRAQCRVSSRCPPPLRARPEPARPTE